MVSKFDKLYKKIISQQNFGMINKQMPMSNQQMIKFRYFLPIDLGDSMYEYKESSDIKMTDIYKALSGLKTMMNVYKCKVVQLDHDNYSFYCDIIVPDINVFNKIVETIDYVENDYTMLTSIDDISLYNNEGQLELVDENQVEMPIPEIKEKIFNFYNVNSNPEYSELLINAINQTINTFRR